MLAPSRAATGGSCSEAVQCSACDFEAARERRSTMLLFASSRCPLTQTNATSLASSSTNAKRRSQRSLFFTGPFGVRHLSSRRHRMPGWRRRHLSSTTVTFGHWEFDAGASIHELAICPCPNPAPAIGAPLAAAAWATVAFNVGPIAVRTAAPIRPACLQLEHLSLLRHHWLLSLAISGARVTQLV
jgi:hypothetical protein